MAKETTYEQWAARHLSLRTTMAGWRPGDERHPAARRQLDDIERRMAVLIDRELLAVPVSNLARDKPFELRTLFGRLLSGKSFPN